MEFHLAATEEAGNTVWSHMASCYLPYGITQCYLPRDTSQHTPP